MHEGRIQQLDSAYNLYHRPANRFVADFIGQGVLVDGDRVDAQRSARDRRSRCADADPPRRHGAPAPGERVDVLLRPDDVVHDDASPVKAMVRPRRSAARRSSTRWSSPAARGALAGAVAPQPHDRRADRHPARARPRHRFRAANEPHAAGIVPRLPSSIDGSARQGRRRPALAIGTCVPCKSHRDPAPKAAAHERSARGSDSVATAPPAAAFFSVVRPRCSSAISLTKDRPRPVLFFGRSPAAPANRTSRTPCLRRTRGCRAPGR